MEKKKKKRERGRTGAVHAGAQTEVTLISQGIIYYKLKLYQVASEFRLLSQKRQIWLLVFLLKGPVFTRSDLSTNNLLTLIHQIHDHCIYKVRSLHHLFHSNHIHSFIFVFLF